MLAHPTVRFLIFCAFVFIIIPSAFGQPASRDPQNKPRKIRQEPARAFKQWIEDVQPIIRPDELEAWKKLQTDEER